MGKHILTGSTGRFETPALKGKNLTDDFVFTVTHDTCMEAEKLPVKFDDAVEGCFILMKHAVFIDHKTADY